MLTCKLIAVIQIVCSGIWLRVLWIFKRTGGSNITSSHANSSKIRQSNNSKVIQEDRRFIPRTKGLWLFGTLFELIASGGAPRLHQYIHQRHKQHGPIFAERLGAITAPDAVFVASAEMMRKLFLYEGPCPRHPVPESWTLYNRYYKCKRGLFFMEGAEWLHNRRILNKLMLNGNLNWMHSYIDSCTEKLVDTWRQEIIDLKKSSVSKNISITIMDLEHQLYLWAINVICSIMFGLNLNNYPDQIEKALENFARKVHKIFESSSALMQMPPMLAFVFNLRAWKDFKQSVSEVLEKSAEIIDMLDQFSSTAGADRETLYFKLQDAGMPAPMIKRIFVDLVIAAGDTTAFTSEWALYVLTQHPDLQEKLAVEVNLSKGDTKQLHLVRGLLRETLRLYPVAPFIGRYLPTDAVIDGYHIKKNTLVLLSLYTSGRELAHFSEPLKVLPERWQRNEQTGQMNGVSQAMGSMPFAIGNRSCIGRKIAQLQLQSLVAAMVKNFHLACENTTPIECLLRLVTVPNQPLRLGLQLRQYS